MSDFIQFVYKAGSPALILGVIIFGLYKVFVYFFDRYFENAKSEIQKDIEKYKSDLDNEKQAFIYSLNLKQQESKSDLDKLLHEHQVKFSSLYTERNKILNHLFGLLAKYYGKAKSLTRIVKLYPMSTSFVDAERALINEIEKLNVEIYDLYSPNRLYFDESVSFKINEFRKEIESVIQGYGLHQEINKFKGDIVYLQKASDKIDSLENKLKLIEIDFRKLLGVE
ncbi:hypothetical protein [Sphingobacterium sp.]|uniref:hypothetical protein n=1 Tax=Sphingobacterium sp. TaxID=341027 RepID=UPI002FD9308A